MHDAGTVGGWSNRTHRPLGCKEDKRPNGIRMIPSVALLGEGELCVQGDPILPQEWPKGDSKREEGISGVYHHLLKLATP